MTKYPTKKEIMAKPWPLHKKDLIYDLSVWKKVVWKNSDTITEKRKALKNLLKRLNAHHKQKIKIKFTPVNAYCPFSPHFDPVIKTIFMNSSLSFLTLLHEYGHSLFGTSELKACRWSIHLFKKAFPVSFAKLRWEGHQLKKAGRRNHAN